jgi:protein phosphatase
MSSTAAVAATPVHPLTSVTLAVATSRNTRSRNEDAVGVAGWLIGGDPTGSLRLGFPVDPGVPFVVAVTDGLGGAPDGHIAAWLAAQRITTPGQASLPARFAAADAELRADRRSAGMACTAAAVLIEPSGDAVLAHVGDVRVWHVRDGYVARLTEDHRAGPAMVTRCLGGARTGAEPDVRTVRLLRGDRLVLCTDGVHDAVDTTVFRLTVVAPDRTAAADALIAAAIAANHGDNATVVVLDVPAPAPPPAAPAVTRGRGSRRRR